MAVIAAEFGSRPAMASRYRRRSLCTLLGETPAPVALRSVSAAGAFVETQLRPPLGSPVTLHHPDAGTIAARVAGFGDDGVALLFDRDAAAVAFALTAIGADMSRAA